MCDTSKSTFQVRIYGFQLNKLEQVYVSEYFSYPKTEIFLCCRVDFIVIYHDTNKIVVFANISKIIIDMN